MKAPSTLLSAIEKGLQVLAFIPATIWIMNPAVVRADFSSQNLAGSPAQIFEVKVPIPNSENTDTIQTSGQSQVVAAPTAQLAYATVVENDPLVTKLRAYLESYNSPLAVYADQIVLQPQWQRSLAISWQESNFGIHCYQNNCSGIGGSPSSRSWRSYETKLDWFKDMSALMEKPMYKERFTNCYTMNGVYNAGSQNWVNSCVKKSNDLIQMTIDAEQERIAMIHTATVSVATNNTTLLK